MKFQILTCIGVLIGAPAANAFLAPQSMRTLPAAATQILSSTSSSSLQYKKKDAIDTKELRHLIESQSSPYADMFQAPETLPEHVHVVVFSPGTTDQGMHTIQYPTGTNVLLAFCDEEDCRDFCHELEVSGHLDRVPEMQRVDFDSLMDFGHLEGIVCQVVPRGVRVQPPTSHVPVLGTHNKDLLSQRQQLQYAFYMVDDDDDDGDTGHFLSSTDGLGWEMEDGFSAWE